jgi:hypothetical protein
MSASGTPPTIHNDQGTHFAGHEVQPWAQEKGMQWKLSEKICLYHPASRSRITNATYSNYNFKRTNARVVLAVDDIWSFLAMDSDGMAYYYGTGTSIDN